MQKLKNFKGSKLVRFLVIAVLMLTLLIIGTLAADAGNFTVQTFILSGMDSGVGDDMQLAVSITNNSGETVNGALMYTKLPTDKITLIPNTVNIKIDDGGWNQAEYAAKASNVHSSLDYKYNCSSTGALWVSLGAIAPGETVTIAYVVNIDSAETAKYYYSFYENNDTVLPFKNSNAITITPLTAEVKPVVEKFSRNASSSDEKANVGDVIEYTIKATNATLRPNSLWMDVKVTDSLPEGVTFMDGTVTIDGDEADDTEYSYDQITRTLTVYLPDLGPNESSIVKFDVTIDEGTYGKTICNSVEVSGKDREDSNKEKKADDDDGDGNTVVSAFYITFDKNAADATGTMDPQIVIENTQTSLEECKFERTGYVFVGWSISPNSKVIAYYDEQAITATRDMTLYAVWDADECTITFDKNADDATGEMPPQTVLRNVTTTLNENKYTRTGYVFKGWSTDPDSGIVAYNDRASITPTGDMTLYAVWDGDECTITFDKNADDATGEMPHQTVLKNVSTELKENTYKRTGYVFAGWSLSPSSKVIAYYDKQAITATRDMTLYAVWDADECTITFDKNADDATGEMTAQALLRNVTTTLKANAFTRTGYVFKGWSLDPDSGDVAYNDQASITPTGDMKLYAVWANATYRITFNKNATDASGTTYYQDMEANVVNYLEQNRFTRSGYAFIGWSTDPSSDEVAYTDRAPITPTGSMTLYALWSRNTCTITFDPNADDATGEMDPQEVGINVTTALLPNAFARPGYYFRGWSTSPDGTEISYGNRGAITLSSDITLYALWGTDPCTIRFYKGASDATGTMEPQKAPANVPVALKVNEFDRSGYYFRGWSTDPYSGELVYDDEQVITPTDDMALYAVWRPIVINVDDHFAYIKGYPDGSVRADSYITRAEAVTIFFRLTLNEEKNDPVAGKFSDVPSNEWYTQAVNFMAKINVINGYADGKFMPGKFITRAEFAKLASRFDNLAFPQGDAFSDVPSSHWAYLYINSAYEKGWVNGYQDGTFKPDRNITRAEVVSLVNSMTNRKIDDDALAKVTNRYNDLARSYWAYADVIEASVDHDFERNNGIETWISW